MPKEADRVAETATTAGTGSITLAGAILGHQTFASAYGTSGNTEVAYSIVQDATGQWEVGRGTFLGGANQLQRTVVLRSSVGGSKVNFPAGGKTVFVTRPAEATIVARARLATDVPIEIRAAAGQSADLLQAYSSGGDKAMWVESTGKVVCYTGSTHGGGIRIGVDGGNILGAVAGSLFIYASDGGNVGFKTEGAEGANVAAVYPGGTAAGQANVIMTREKGDARYGVASSLRYKDDVTVAERVPGFLEIDLHRWAYGGELAEDDFRRGRAGYGHIVEDLAPVLPEAVEKDEKGRPDRLNVGPLLGALHAEIKHLAARLDALEQLVFEAMKGQ